jgi:hypothetical protein
MKMESLFRLSLTPEVEDGLRIPCESSH